MSDPRMRRAELLAELARLVRAQGEVLAELAQLDVQGLAARPTPAQPRRRRVSTYVVDPTIQVSELDAARAAKALRRNR